MFGVREYLLGAVLVGVLALIGTVYVQHQRINTLSEKVETASATIAAFSVKAKGTEKLIVEKKEKDHAAQEAYAADPVWSGDVVPDDVADLLRDRGTR